MANYYQGQPYANSLGYAFKKNGTLCYLKGTVTSKEVDATYTSTLAVDYDSGHAALGSFVFEVHNKAASNPP